MSKFPKIETAVVVAIAMTCGICVTQAFSSDWVEDNVTQLQIQPNTTSAPKRPKQVDNSSLDLTPSTTSGAHSSYGSAIDVTDPGAGSSASIDHAPLEANVSQTESHNDNGLGRRAAGIMSRAPMSDPPATKQVSPKVFHDWIENTHPNLAITNHKAIIEIKGEWDNAGHALHSFGLPSTRVGTGKELETALSTASILIVNCAGDVPDDALPVISKFVQAGGFLITTDWALNGCLSRAIPGYVEWNSGYSEDQVVDAVVVEDDLDFVTGTVPYAHWKLDNKSQTVKILKPRAVHVLVRSRQLTQDDPDGLGVLALTFRFGKGRVLHLVGHFDNNTNLAFTNSLPDPAPIIQISLRQAIAANFVVEALKEHGELTR